MTQSELHSGHMSRLVADTIPLEDLEKFSGLELLQRLIEGLYSAPTMAATLNFNLVDASEGRAVFRGRPGTNHLNPLGGVHGGWAAAIMDSALGCCVHSTMNVGEAYTTAEFKVNLTRPITPDIGEVECVGHVVHRGRTLAVSEASLKDKNGKLLAFGTETCSIFPAANLARR